MSDANLTTAPLSQAATLSDQVTEVLRDNIVRGIWPVGKTLPSESGLAEELDVSRTVIREAVSRLKAEGMISSRQGKGACVSSNRPRMGFAIADQDVESLRKLAEILELRMGLEIEAAALAARRATDDERDAIATAAQAFERASDGAAPHVEEGVSTDLQFHRAICEATGNGYYLALFNYLGASLRETILAGRLKAVARGSDSSDAVLEHHDIAAAIAAGMPDRARERMRRHLELSSSRLLARLGPVEGEDG